MLEDQTMDVSRKSSCITIAPSTIDRKLYGRYADNDAPRWKLNRLFSVTVCLLFLTFLGVSKLIPFNHIWSPAESFFQPTISPEDEDIFFELMSVVQKALESANVVYYLNGGSLIGTKRHHGFIPWDDDVDIYIDAIYRTITEQALTNVSSRYLLSKKPFRGYFYSNDCWKFSMANSTKYYIIKPFRWPYIDILFVQDDGIRLIPRDAYPTMYKSQVFPLQRAPFKKSSYRNLLDVSNSSGNILWLPVPCTFLHPSALDICTSKTFSHFSEIPMFIGFQRTIPCSRLHGVYPFVSHFQVNATKEMQLGDDIGRLNVEEFYTNSKVHYRLITQASVCTADYQLSRERFQISKADHVFNDIVPTYFANGFVIH